MFGLKDTSYQHIITAISNFKEIETVIIFGSRAKGNYKKGSDIDLAIKGKNLNYDTVIRLSTILNQELPIPYFVDVVHYETLTNKELVDHIDRVGKIFFPLT